MKASLCVLFVVLLLSVPRCVMADDAKDLAKVTRIQKALDQTILPELTFQDVPLKEALDSLVNRIRALKIDGHPISVSIVIEEGPPNPAAVSDTVENLLKAKRSFSFTKIPISEALSNVSGEGDLKYIVEASGIQIVPWSMDEPQFRREFRIPPDFFPAYEKQDRLDHTDHATTYRQNFNIFLWTHGVHGWHGEAYLNADATRLTARNTVSQLDLISHILLTVRPECAFPNYGLEVPKIIAQGENAALTRKLQRIILPEVKFEGTRLIDAVQILRDLSVRYDTESPRTKRGVNIVLEDSTNHSSAAPFSSSPEKPDPRDDPTADYTTLPMSIRELDYTGTQVTLLEALEAVAERGLWEVYIGQSAVTLRDLTSRGPMTTQEYLLSPGVAAELSDHADRSRVDSETIRNLLIANGVTFPSGSSVSYQKKTSRVILRNSKEQQMITRRWVERMWRAYYDAKAGRVKANWLAD